MTHVLDSPVAPFVPSHVHIPLTTSQQVGGAWAINAGSTTVNERSYEVSTRPIRWDWNHSEAGFTACDHVTGIFGFGADLNEAIRDLIQALLEHRDVLDRQDSLSPDLKSQLEYLQSILG